jgi:hypothetical protein
MSMTEAPQKLTKTDLEIGRIYYGILIEQARSGQTLSYGDLVARAKNRNPENESVLRAIAVSTGRRLEAVRVFTNERGYPDITSLVVNASTGEVGSAFGTDPAAHRAEIAVFDWSSVDTEFDLFLGEQHAALPVKRKKLKAADARQIVWEFYIVHKANLPAGIVGHRDRLQKMVMDGHAVADAFETEVATVSTLSV